MRPTPDNLKDILECNPETGTLKWKARPRGDFKNEHGWKIHVARYANKQAGHHSDEYSKVRINDVGYRSHRIIWELVNGPIPKGMQVDHVNGNKKDNRLVNLRLATHGQNQQNSPASKSNRCGLKGVSFVKRRSHLPTPWTAYIKHDNVRTWLGLFHTKGSAAAAYAKAAIRYHNQFART